MEVGKSVWGADIVMRVVKGNPKECSIRRSLPSNFNKIGKMPAVANKRQAEGRLRKAD